AGPSESALPPPEPARVPPLCLPAETPTRRRPPPPNLPGYEILGELGHGGMGVVYCARQVALDRVVALKMILAGDRADAEELTRFQSEAAAVARLKHPNIVQIYEVGEHEGQPYFALEYVAGGTLAEAVAGLPQAPAAAAQLVEILACAVDTAHRAGVVHRDLKPANILLQKDEGGTRNDETATGRP